jgi:hypothetical protein
MRIKGSLLGNSWSPFSFSNNAIAIIESRYAAYQDHMGPLVEGFLTTHQLAGLDAGEFVRLLEESPEED